MPELITEFDLSCYDCGSTLDARIEQTDVSVEPCATCLNEQDAKSYDKGHKDGYQEATTLNK